MVVSEQQPTEELAKAQALAEQPPELPVEAEAIKQSDPYEDENYILIQYQALLDRSLKGIQLVSSNGLRRVFTSYLKAGVYDVARFQDKAEHELFNSIMQLHDIKYTLIMKAIDSSAKKAEEEQKLKEGESNGQQQ